MRTPHKSINPAFLKLKPHRGEIDHFKVNLLRLLQRVNPAESEEFHKNLLRDFLKDSYYKQNYFINTKGRKDLVIHTGKKADTPVGVIIETKSPANKYEMCSKENLNTKALQELLLYYLEERVEHKNTELKHLIVTNIHEYFIFKAPLFEKLVYKNKSLVKKFQNFKLGGLSGDKTDFFYHEIAKPFIDEIRGDLEYTYVDIRDFTQILYKKDPVNDKKLIAPYKLFSPEHMLVLPFANDSNSLDKRFYSELLHLIGLKEIKQGSKKLIQRYPEGKRHPGSLLENAIDKLESRNHLSQIQNLQSFGVTREEQLFGVGLELCITWINRILFLKLLEAQLLSYHKENPEYKFLNIKRIQNYDDLDNLFFSVLAKRHTERSEENRRDYANIPYLNSSLFEPSQLEYDTLFITDLRDDRQLPPIASTVLKDAHGKKHSGNLNTLEYLFRFLDAYDFSSEGKEDIQEEHKTLINASVLGLIFEKINGYKDGSYFTPGFITEYMCRETLRRAVVQKFNEAKGWDCKDLTDLYNKDFDLIEANAIINSLKICDPAVGSGHFLVSALNEILAIKHELEVLCDREGRRLKHYQIEVMNDELIVRDHGDGSLFEYHPGNDESQRVQETLFHEKQTIIENCLFGVDINPNSVKICRLRLWIELLKNAYYKNDDELETLPNIDINIKCGNSLISRFDIKADLSTALKKSKYDIDSYRDAVCVYRNARNKDEKNRMRELIEEIKGSFRSEIYANDPKMQRLYKMQGQLFTLQNQTNLFSMDAAEKARWEKKIEKLTAESQKLEMEIAEIKNSKIYENAFEWRFEFPEVLDQNGDFIGFDVVIGNPPYMGFQEVKNKEYYNSFYDTAKGKYDIYVLFIELVSKISSLNHQSGFIIPHKYLIAGFGKALRKIMSKKGFVNKVIHFQENMVFEDATTYTCLTFFSNNNSKLKFAKITPSQVKQITEILLNEIDYKELSETPWHLVDKQNKSIIDKIENSGIKSKQLFKGVFQGIVTGDNQAFYVYNCVIQRDKITGFSKATNRNITLEKGICRKLLNGKNLIKWSINFDNTYIIYPYELINNKTKSINESKLNSKFPLTYNYLTEIKERLSNRGSDKMKYPIWYALWNARSIKNQNSPKIITPDICLGTKMSLDEKGEYYHNDTSYTIIPQNKYSAQIYFFLGVLNSNLIWHYLSQTGNVIRGGYFRFKTNYLTNLSIPVENDRIINRVSKKVKTLINNPENKKNESEIDQLVYELYGLTEEEIRIVEGSGN